MSSGYVGRLLRSSCWDQAILEEEQQKFSRYYPMVEVVKLCIMPDHLHMIVRIREDNARLRDESRPPDHSHIYITPRHLTLAMDGVVFCWIQSIFLMSFMFLFALGLLDLEFTIVLSLPHCF